MKWSFLLGVLFLFASAQAKGKGFGPGEQDYGYVEVRPGAHSFWWLYHTTADVPNPHERPLMLWLQGGPGGSSCGYGNFEIIGPLDLNLEPRDHTWVKDFNLLLVDNPVGTGYSYVESLSLLTTDNLQIARDLVTLMQSFYEQLPEFRNTPFYVYGQSYGGKMAVDFVKLLVEEVRLGNIQSNISGVAMGNAWIHPIDSTLSWAHFLYQWSLVDEDGEEAIYNQALVAERTFNEGNYAQATNEWARTQQVVFQRTDGVDFYNVVNKPTRNNRAIGRTDMEKAFDMLTYSKYYNERAWNLNQLMNGPVKEALGIPSHVIWGSQSNAVFNYLSTDFMKPVTDVVEDLLNDTTVSVHAYNGNLDLIVDTPGQMRWVNRLRWPDVAAFHSAPRKTIWVDNQMEGYEKEGGKFMFFWLNVAGHSVPADNPAGTRSFLRTMTGV